MADYSYNLNKIKEQLQETFPHVKFTISTINNWGGDDDKIIIAKLKHKTSDIQLFTQHDIKKIKNNTFKIMEWLETPEGAEFKSLAD